MNRQYAVVIASGLALFTAIVHLIIGIVDIYGWLVNGESVSILPFGFVLFSVLVFLLLYTYANGLLREAQAYATGVLVMSLPIVGYADWHATGITESALDLDEYGLGHEHSHNGDSHDHNGDGEHSHDDDHSHNGDDHEHADDDHSHADGVVEVTVDHLRDDMIALSTKLAEFGAATLFAVLAIDER